jgi:sugar-specific transcriptional regulator TrmB
MDLRHRYAWKADRVIQEKKPLAQRISECIKKVDEAKHELLSAENRLRIAQTCQTDAMNRLNEVLKEWDALIEEAKKEFRK